MIRRAIETYALRFPYHPGKWRVVEAAVRLSGLEAEDQGRTFEVERAGVRWRLGIDCAVQRRLFYHGVFDIHDVKALLAHVPEGGIFFDVGSYFGYYALLAARRGAEVHAFEPSPPNFAHLYEHAALNPWARLHCHRIALSDEVGRAAFALASDDNRGTGHLVTPGSGEAYSEIQATTLDAFVDAKKIGRIAALKIDVEGAELRVLRGAENTLRRDRPVLLVEVNEPCLRRAGGSAAELTDALRALDYRLVRTAYAGPSEFVSLAPREDYTNVLCLPR